MNGKNTFKKTMRKVKSSQVKSGNPYIGPYMQIGSWRLEENDNGDLVIMNLETGNMVTLMKK